MPLTAAAQTIELTTTQSFEVVSIKRNLSGDPASGRRQNDRFIVTSTPLVQLIRQAYDLPENRILDLPEWALSERYDVNAKAPEGVQVGRALAPMLRSLLRDRFGFVARVDTREMPVYELIVARADGKLGPSLTESSCNCAGDRTEAGCRQGPPSAGPEISGMTCAQLGVAGRSIFRGYPMSVYARYLSGGRIDRVVIDRTGLTGTWNAEIVSAADPSPATDGVNSDLPSFFTAIQEQLGLKLRPARAPVPVLIIESIHPPTPD
jgi:uncharacterized protein (TIGR03435 family)